MMPKCVKCGKKLYYVSCTIDDEAVCQDCFSKEQSKMFEDSEAKTNAKPMLRLHELTSEQIEDWRVARADVGRKKYGDAHLQRYGVVDVMEELLDAENILSLIYDRVRRGNVSISDMQAVVSELLTFRSALIRLQAQLLELDEYLNDAECTDELGGNRIWWGEQSETIS